MKLRVFLVALAFASLYLGTGLKANGDVCADDRVRLCGMDKQTVAATRCLQTKREQLSAQCRETIERGLQGAPEKSSRDKDGLMACIEDQNRLCSHIRLKSFKGRHARREFEKEKWACFNEKRTEWSEECKQARERGEADQKKIRYVCKKDAIKFCSTKSPAGSAWRKDDAGIKECLKDKTDKVSAPCRQALEQP